MGLTRLFSSQFRRIMALVVVLALPLFLLQVGYTPPFILADDAECSSPFLDDFLTVEFAEGSPTSGPPGTEFTIVVTFEIASFNEGSDDEVGAQAEQIMEVIWDWELDPEPSIPQVFERVGQEFFDDGDDTIFGEPSPNPITIDAVVPLTAEPGIYPIAACYSEFNGEGTSWRYGMFEGDGEAIDQQIKFTVTEPEPTEEPDEAPNDDEADEDESEDEDEKNEAQAEAKLTPVPTTTPQPTPTLITLPTNTAVPATPVPPTEVPATPPPPIILGAQTPAAQATVAPQPTTAPQPTAAPASPTSAPAPTGTSGPAPPPSPTAPPSPTQPSSDVLGTTDRPEIFRIVPSPNEVSGDIDVILTNLGLAGFTLMIIFATAAVFNQTVNDNQPVIEGMLVGFLAPFAGIKSGFQGMADNFGFLKNLVWPLLVLGLTVGVYGFLEPGFGFNEKSIIVVASLLLAAGAITYLTDGVEVFIANQVYGQNAAVRIFPFAIIVAAISVVISRLISFEPGVLYGFVALAVYLRPHSLTPSQEGRSVWIPAVILLTISVVSWLALIPLRDAIDGGNNTFLIAFLEGVAVAVFIGGLEGVFFNMMPLSFMDGEKVYRWSKLIWALTMGTAALLFWHVLLNDQSEYFGAISETTPMIALIVGGVCLGLTVGAWLFFKLKTRAA